MRAVKKLRRPLGEYLTGSMIVSPEIGAVKLFHRMPHPTLPAVTTRN